jgi:hypothetical protein
VAAGCVAGDTFTLRTGGPGSIPSGSQASSTATSYTNPLWVNCYNNGMTLHKNSGNLAFVVGGTGAGQPPVTLNDNTATGFTCSPWTIQPDKTSVIELVEANPQVTSIGKPLPLANYANWQGVLGSVGVPNYFGQVVRVEVYTADSDGNMGPQQTVAFRDIYVEGSQGTRIVTASTTQISTDAWILCQATSAITVQILPAAQWLNGAMGVENDSPNSSTVTVQFAVDNGVAETDNNGNTSVTLAAGQVWSGRGHA